MLFVTVGVAFAVLLGTLVATVAGALALAATLIGAGIWRARAPRATRAAGIAVRGKTLDVVFYFGTGVAIAILALLIPYQG